MKSIQQINYIKTPPSTIYRALTTQEGLSEVWTRNLSVKPDLGAINRFDFDDGYLTEMKVVELQKDTRVVWECIQSDKEWVGTEISFDISAENGVSKVSLSHDKWSEITDFYRWCNYNWAMFLLSLKSYCEKGKGIPFQEREF
ncbi:SRPBCC family protein [Negadavirga shengliensis]|uniref:SRPBCC domain-containing protein n=1 Tax=Negadavirga shengliensis TaxID=1389218 RepID=A0ABV9T4S1_9BACT